MSILSKLELANPDKSQLGLDIEAAIIQIRNNHIYDNTNIDSEMTEISKAVNRNLDSNYKILLTEGHNAFIQPPTMDKNSPMWRRNFVEYFEDYLEADASTAVKRSSTGISEMLIDGGTGKYRGLAAETEVKVSLGWNILNDERYTPASATAVLLHELGHGDSMWRSLGHTVRGNYTLNAIQSIMLGAESRDVKVKLIKKVAKSHNLPIQDNVEEMVKLNNNEVTRTVVVGGMAATQRDELGCSGYTARGFEALADAFATLHGYGTPLNQALLALPGGRSSVLGSGERMAAMVGETFIWMAAALSTGGAAALIPMLIILCHDPEEVIYDDPYARAKRIANMQIEKLKASKGRNDGQLIKDIEASLKIAEMYTKNPHWMQMVSEAVMPSNRLNKQLREFQQMLEDLQSNPLYVKAARLNAVA